MFAHNLIIVCFHSRAFQDMLVVKNMPVNAGDIRGADSTPGSGRSSGAGHGNPFQYSCLENLIDKEVWQAQTIR